MNGLCVEAEMRMIAITRTAIKNASEAIEKVLFLRINFRDKFFTKGEKPRIARAKDIQTKCECNNLTTSRLLEVVATLLNIVCK